MYQIFPIAKVQPTFVAKEMVTYNWRDYKWIILHDYWHKITISTSTSNKEIQVSTSKNS